MKGSGVMLIVSQLGEIKLTRGDTAWLTVTITRDTGELYEIQNDDTLTLSVKKKITDKEYAFKKEVKGKDTFHIEPKDTENLYFGCYKYEVQVTTKDGDVYTVIEPTTFELLEEVT